MLRCLSDLFLVETESYQIVNSLLNRIKLIEPTKLKECDIELWGVERSLPRLHTLETALIVSYCYVKGATRRGIGSHMRPEGLC
jgi:hypothetical protein